MTWFFDGLLPWSFRAQYRREVRAALRTTEASPPLLSEVDIAALPALVRRYITRTGALGQPRVRNVHVTFEGRIRMGPEKAWMDFKGEQVNTYDPKTRYFILDARMHGIPVKALHRFVGASASMRVKAASIVPIVDASGPEMVQAETVTLVDDMCVFAPGTLVDPKIEWLEVDAHNVAAAFTNGGVTIRATLTFNAEGELTDFVSDDRLAGSSDSKSFTPMRWSTPLRDYTSFGAHYLSGYGAGRWHPEGAPPYDYIQISVKSIHYNVLPASIR